MKTKKIFLPLLAAFVIAAASGAIENSGALDSSVSAASASKGKVVRSSPGIFSARPERFRLAPERSQFMVEAYSGGLLWFMGHTHHFAIKEFSGEAEAASDTLNPGSLHLTVKADSLEETGANFTEEQKKIINGGARKEVLQTASYPEIVFQSADVKSEKVADNQFKAEIGGNLTLHGVTRRIMIPAHVTINGNTLKASGEFSINRSDFGVKTHSIKGGMIRVRDKVKFTFDIQADKF
jgi:polyisoprenoid-binding protein YceI